VRLRPVGTLALLPLVLVACAHRAPARAPEDAMARVPAFARVPYEPFARGNVVAIALREWRLFGQPVDDDPPGTRPRPAPEDKPERVAGLWQRVGEYWWLGQDPDRPESAWTGKHDQSGRVFPANVDGDYAWSAAFVSYVMRIAGAGGRFPYAPAHHTYIDIGQQMATGATHGWVVVAERLEAYAPQSGDLVCTSRTTVPVRFEDLPAGSFPAHCDIVVQTGAGSIEVIGGNVDDAVTLKHVPVTPDGHLATADGRVLDGRYNWFVALRVLYDDAVS
jgi:hypothetical protein